MEGLIELVAASFARNGIECPAADFRSAGGLSAAPVEPTTNTPAQPVELSLAVTLPEHNFRKGQQGDPAP